MWLFQRPLQILSGDASSASGSLSSTFPIPNTDQTQDENGQLEKLKHIHPLQELVQAQRADPNPNLNLPTSGPTLLPPAIASLVSLFSKSTTLSIRLGSLIGESILSSARATTLSSLELARAGVEGILIRAGQDLQTRRVHLTSSSSPLTTATSSSSSRFREDGTSSVLAFEADNRWTDQILTRVHAWLTLAQLLISMGFEASSTGLAIFKEFSQNWVYVIDSIFGETESSRAIKAIIDLIIKEFGENNKGGREGAEVTVNIVDLLAGLACFAILQKRGRRRTAKEVKMVIIWDVVVGEEGRGEATVLRREGQSEKLSVVTAGGSDKSREEWCENSWKRSTNSILKPSLKNGKAECNPITFSIGQHIADKEVCDNEEMGIDKQTERDTMSICDSESSDKEDYFQSEGNHEELAHLLARLPPSAQVSVTWSTTKTQRTTVEVTNVDGNYINADGGLGFVDFKPPKDAVILAEESYQASGGTGIKSYKITYETVKENVRGRKIMHDGGSVVLEKVKEPDPSMRVVEIHGRKPSCDSKNEHEHLEMKVRRKPSGLTVGHLVGQFEKRKGEEGEREKEKLRKHTEPRKSHANKDKDREKRRNKVYDSTEKEKRNKSKSLRKALTSVDQLIPGHRSTRLSLQTNKISSSEDHQMKPCNLSLGESTTKCSPINIDYAVQSHLRKEGTELTATTPRRSTSSSSSNSYWISSPPINTQTIVDSSIARDAASESSANCRRPSTYAPSVYTLRTSHSQTSLTLEYASHDTFENDCSKRNYYPHDRLCQNMLKFMRFASASYGSNFMRLLGISAAATAPPNTTASYPAASRSIALLNPFQIAKHHAEHHAFSFHTSLPVDTILLSSFMDPGGGYDAHGDVNTGVPLVHFICVDHKAKSVVLTCRGTLGLDDVVTDLTCEYGDLNVRGRNYRVHKGMLNSALLLLRRRGHMLISTIANALRENGDYGLVLVGHSLGGGVASILAILLSTPVPTSSLSGPNSIETANSVEDGRGSYTFVTSNSFLSSPIHNQSNVPSLPSPTILLPEGRPIHCYAYGSPACICSSLRVVTRGLVTSVVYGRDIVPSLSFGMIKDFHAVALAFKEDTQGVKAEIARRVLANLTRKGTGLGSDSDNSAFGGRSEWESKSGAVLFEDGDDDYLYAILKTLRAGMDAEKLVPPGEVYLVETQTVFRKRGDATADNCREGGAGVVDVRPATRITAKVVKDVEKRFGEVGFGRGMFSDHNPKNYEGALEALCRGVCPE